MFGVRAAFLVAAILLAASTAHAQTSFDTIYGFGDSYADTNRPGDPGGILRFVPPALLDPTRTPQGRFSSGLNFVDRLESNLDVPQAVNYAFGGALTNSQNVSNPAGPGFAQQIQIVQFVTDQDFRPNDIIALSIGGNNANAILAGNVDLGSDPIAGATEYARTSAEEVGNGVQTLVDRGARTITYFSVGAPELYPARTALPAPDLAAGATVYLQEFLKSSQQQFAEIAAQGVRVNFFNFAVLQQRVLLGGEANKFGFINVTGVPTTSEVPCAAGPCDVADAAGLFYWDGVHLTEAGYNLAADFMTIQLAQNETIPVAADLAEIQARNFTDTLSQRMEARRYGGSGYDGGTSAKDADPKRLSFKDEPAPSRDDRYAMFVAGGLGGGERDPRPGEVDFDYNLTNIVVGAELKPGEHSLLGAAIGYTRSNADYNFLLGHGETDLDSVNIGAYASLSYPNYFADLTLAYAANSYDLSRTGIVSPFGQGIALDTSADTDGHSFVADFRTGYLFRSGAFGVGPIGGLNYAHVTVDGYTESGDSLLTMKVGEQELESLIGSIGVQLRYKGDRFEPYVAVTLEKEFLGDRSYEFALTSASPVVNTVDVGEESDPFGRVRAGLKAHISDAVTGSIDGNATFGREFGDDYAVSGSLTYRF